MLARILHALPGSLGLAGLGFLACTFFAGPAASAAGAAVAAGIGLALALGAPHPRVALRRQFRACAVILAVHAASLYTFGSSGPMAVLAPGLQASLATLVAAACWWCAARIATPAAAAKAVVRDEDPDHTLEIDSLRAVATPPTVTVETLPAPPLRRVVIGGVVTCALLVIAALYWLDEPLPVDGLPTASATELPSRSDPVVPADAGLPPADAPVPGEPGTAEVVPQVADAAPSPAAASAARRECMAQIESARLFLQIARDADDQTEYSQATGHQIARMLKARPVGPRTLSRIAERMWEKRAAPERDSGWWSSQYQRCEAARSSGAWYVVKG